MSESSSSQPKAAGQATIKNGVYTDKVAAGTTVADARKRMHSLNSMPADTTAYINGAPVPETHVLQGTDTLSFMKRSGEKG